jgi:predicted porin
MKYRLAVIASLAAVVNSSSAASSLTTYGSIDAGLRNLSNTNAVGDSTLTMGSNGTFRSNRLGFKGVEELGDGLAVNFVIESGFNTGTGALNNTNNILFQRESHVGLSLGGHAVDLGNQYTLAYRTGLKFDPFAYRYPSITYALSASAGTRKTNDIQYTGKFGAVTAMAEYALGEVTGSTRDGATRALGATYDDGTLKLGASYSAGRPNTGTAAVAKYMDSAHYNLGGSYTAGAVQVSAGYVNSVQKTATSDTRSKWRWAGVSYKFDARWALTGAWYRNQAFNTTATAAAAAGHAKKDLFMTGMTYNLSKRSNLYAEIDVNKLNGGYATGGTTKLNQSRQTGMSAGIMHMF